MHVEVQDIFQNFTFLVEKHWDTFYYTLVFKFWRESVQKIQGQNSHIVFMLPVLSICLQRDAAKDNGCSTFLQHPQAKNRRKKSF
jgi:hypothetical protein